VSRVVLLDRDGVLNVDRPRSVTALSELALEPGADRAVALLSRAGYAVLVITNQAAVGRGELSEVELVRIHDQLSSWMAAAGGRIDRFYVCPHAEAAQCACRKPKPGLIEQARAAWHFLPAETWFVGDATRDVQACRAAGCRPALVATGKGRAAHEEDPSVPFWPSLLAFATDLTSPIGSTGTTGPMTTSTRPARTTP
jgi:D-glycero-D-manno-heptose 1,7-bisphosphate phosphatase